MNKEEIKNLLQSVKNNEIEIDKAMEQVSAAFLHFSAC